jgi:hypothetical protein
MGKRCAAREGGVVDGLSGHEIDAKFAPVAFCPTAYSRAPAAALRPPLVLNINHICLRER